MAGIPSIVSNVTSNGPQEMIGYGRYGEIFDVGDPVSLSKKMKLAMLKIDKDSYDSSYRDRMSENLDISIAIKKYIDFIS